MILYGPRPPKFPIEKDRIHASVCIQLKRHL